MGHWFQCYAFDVIGLITYSKRLGFLDRGEDVAGVIGALESHLKYATLVGFVPWLHPYLFRLRNWVAARKGQGAAGVAYVRQFTMETMAEHESNSKVVSKEAAENDPEKAVVAQDFLTKWIAKHTANPDAMTKYMVLAGCQSNMVAGSDTTAIGLSSMLYYMLKYPRVFDKLRAEVDAVEETRAVPSQYITFDESQNMPYLQAVMKEALRIFSATGLPMERVVPEGPGLDICGYHFPPKVRHVHLFSMISAGSV